MKVVLIVLAVLLVIAAVLIPLLKAKLAAGEGEAEKPGAGDQYTLLPTVFTPAERSFLGVLDGVLPDGVAWLGKVRLGDVFTTRKGLQPSQRTSARNRINQKHVDFLLVRMTDFSPLAGIELDDKSHDAADRKDRDAFVDEVFRSGGLPLLHFPAQATYSPAALRTAIAASLEGRAAAPAAS
jgi:hypothetical protein